MFKDYVAERIHASQVARDAKLRILAQLAGTMPIGDVAQWMGMTKRAVECLAQRNGISIAFTRIKWTGQEVAILKKHASTHSAQEIADMLPMRTKTAVVRAAVERNIPLLKHGEHHHAAKHSDEDVELCRALHEEAVSTKDIAEKMGLPEATVRGFVNFCYRV